jgi:hypothetical protein
MNANLAYDPNSEIQIGCDKNLASQLYGNYYDFCEKSGSKIRSSKDFSPQMMIYGKGLLERVKTNSKNVIKGVRFSESGGLLESLAKLQKSQTSNHPPQPPHPPQNEQASYTARVTEVESTLHSPSTPVEGSGGSNAHPPLTLHSHQSITPNTVQPLNSLKVEGVEGKNELSHLSKNNLRIVIDGQADYLGDVVTIIGFDGKKGTVDVQFSSGRKKTVKRAELKAVNSTPSQQSMTNGQQPMTSNQQQLNL